jgi:hypothetical protein
VGQNVFFGRAVRIAQLLPLVQILLVGSADALQVSELGTSKRENDMCLVLAQPLMKTELLSGHAVLQVRLKAHIGVAKSRCSGTAGTAYLRCAAAATDEEELCCFL